MENKGFSNESMIIENNKKTCEYDDIELDDDNYNSFNYSNLPFEIEIIITKE